MSYPINQKLNQTYQPTMGLNQPQLQNVDADKIQQGLTQNSALKGVAGGEEKNGWLTPALSVPVFIGMSLGMDKFNKACGGNYEDSLIGKSAQWAENVGNNKFFSSKPMKWLETTLTSGGNYFKTKIVPRSKILSAMINTPSEPTNRMVLMMKNGTIAEVASDAVQKLEEHLKNGATLKLEGKVLTIEDMEKLSKEAHTMEGIDKIIKICEDQGSTIIKSKRIGKIPFSKKISGEVKYLSEQKGMKWLGNILGREVNFTEYVNKMNAFKAPKGTTWLGKGVPKAMIRLVEGLTNGTAGGKIAILMAAYFVADAIKKTIDAPKGKGEKTKTFSENLIYNEAMYLTMPLGIKIMHSMGGLQYIGISKDKIDKFRAELTAFNDKVKAGGYTDKAAFKAEKTRIKNILTSDIDFLKGEKFSTRTGKIIRNIVNKPLQLAARILTVGLENFEAFNPKGINVKSSFGEKFEHFFKTGRFVLKEKTGGFKWAAGGPMRFLFYMFVIAPPLGKLGAKCSHLIFGRPTKSVLDEGKEEPKAEEAKQPLPIMPSGQFKPQQNVGLAAPQATANVANNQMASTLGGNLIDSYKANTVAAPSTSIATEMVNTTQQKAVTTPQEPVRTYVPSSEGVKVEHTNERKNQVGLNAPDVQLVMNRADNMEKAANKFVPKKD